MHLLPFPLFAQVAVAPTERHGRISGHSGAAPASLGIPRQTLESKIRRLGIDEYGQKAATRIYQSTMLYYRNM